MRRKQHRIEAGLPTAPLQDQVDRLRRERPPVDIAPLIDAPEYRPGQGRRGLVDRIAGSLSMRSSMRSPATSERRRPPEANAVSSSAWSRRSTSRLRPRASAPLSTRPLAWRAASIDAMAELAGLVECRGVGTVPTFVHKAFRTIRRGEGEQAPGDPAAASQDESAVLKLRTDGDYRRLALQISIAKLGRPCRRAAAGRISA